MNSRVILLSLTFLLCAFALPSHVLAVTPDISETIPADSLSDNGQPVKTYSSSTIYVGASTQGITSDAFNDWDLRTYYRPEKWTFDLRAKDHGYSTIWWGDVIQVFIDDELVHTGGSIRADYAKTTWTLNSKKISPGNHTLRFKFRYFSPTTGGSKLLSLSGYPIEILLSPTHTKLTLGTTTPYIGRGQWANLTGTLTDERGEGIPGKEIHVKGRFPISEMRRIASATTDANGRYTKWIRPTLSKTYSVEYDGDAENDSALNGFADIRVSPVSLYSVPSSATFGWWRSAPGSWVKLAGHMLDIDSNPISGAKIYLQKRETSGTWSWVATAYTSSTGYYQAWLQPKRTADYMAMAEKNPSIGVDTRFWSAKKRVTVRYRTDLTATPSLISFGGWVKLQGSVRPWHTQGTVYMQWYDYGQQKWRYLGTTSIGSKSNFTYWYKPRWKGYGSTPWKFRAKIVGHWDHATAYTPVQTLEVR